MRFNELAGIYEESMRNVDLEEYNTGVCEEFALYTHTSDLYGVPYFIHIFIIIIMNTEKIRSLKNTEQIWREHGNIVEKILRELRFLTYEMWNMEQYGDLVFCSRKILTVTDPLGRTRD